jgi:hypothetical protein
MTRYGLCLFLLLSAPLAPVVRAQDAGAAQKEEAKPLLETWQAAYFEGLKVGHVHTRVTDSAREGKKCIRTVREMNLVVKRYGSVIPIRIEQTSDETADGKVLALTSTEYLAADQKKTSTGVVKAGKLTYTAPDETQQTLDWNDDAIGQYRQEVIFEKKKVKTGDRFKFLSYELLLPGPLTIRVVVKDFEGVDRLAPKKEGKTIKIVREPAKLLRVETIPDKVVVGDREIQLPAKIVWLDGKFMPVREQFEMPGLGPITFYHTTKEAALKEGVAPELLPDLGLKASIPLKQIIDDPYKTTEAVYRITLKDNVAKVFTEDTRQEVRDKMEKTFELAVKAIRKPGKVESPIVAGKEYLESNHFIDSANARIRATAAKAVGEETGSWSKALNLEKWVHDNMEVSSAIGFPSAGQICRDLKGDCRQHAILLTALCRAAEIPARTAVGLIYVHDKGRSPYFGFHMWTEVAIDGQWLGLDAILGQGGIAATHLKMGDHSWTKTATLAPLLPVSQALGKVQIEVVSSK